MSAVAAAAGHAERSVAVVAMVVALAAAAPVAATPAEDAPARVILITLDGARWQDVLGLEGALFPNEHPLMPTLLARASEQGVVFGTGNGGGEGAVALTSSPTPMSLPGYQALMVGHTTCVDNAGPRVVDETLPERIARELALPPAQVAVFASWSKVARAATAKDGLVFVDVPPMGPSRPRRNGGAGPPWPNARYDDDTADLALAHLERHRPRFLYLALLDMDEHAHNRDARATADALRAADRVLAKVFAFVDSLPAAERARTTVLVTADHGRGPGPFWFDHRKEFTSARDIFLLAVGAAVELRGDRPRTKQVTQADVRPTIEALFGLAPRTRSASPSSPGSPITEIVGVTAP